MIKWAYHILAMTPGLWLLLIIFAKERQRMVKQNSFGEILKTFRNRKKWSQRALASQLGVHYNTIWAWERGDYLPDTKGMVLELARLLMLSEEETRHLPYGI